ncbi:MAG: 3-deoxy-7-phosphoheptulonate synthase, partial [Gemmatimonadetes bacterium]|nr:3-deoxy-7-phosphoheptulonate synthase [Gemmatimonadota bacterium]
AAVAAGADGLIVEVHPDPPNAASDGRQSLTPEAFTDLMRDLTTLADAVGRRLDSPEP